MSKLLLSIDQGTTGTTVALFDAECRMRAKVNREFRQIFPRPGWVEHDLDDIWESVTLGIDEALRQAGARGADVEAIGITNQRETTCVWERDSLRPIHHAIVWQCRRTAPLCQTLKDAGHEALFRQRTGLVLDPYFSGTKLRWLLDELPDARKRAEAGDLCFGTIDSWLVSRLSGGQAHVIEASNASRTLMMNLETLDWDAELLSILGVPRAMLPAVRSSSEHYASVRGVDSLPDGIPICGMAGDQQAALFGQACFQPGQVKCTYGTGAFVLMNTGDELVRSQRGLLTTVGWKVGDRVTYALEGSVFIAGAAVQWLRDGLGLIRESAEIEALAASVSSSDGVVFVPALVGLGAPRWKAEARGVICGLTRGTTAAHLARAALEGIAFQVRDVIETMRSDAGSVDLVRVDGGAAQNELLLQFQADLLAVEIHRPRIIETTALGAALLAGLAAGVWKGLQDIQQRWELDRRISPRMEAEEVQAHLARWEAAVAKA
ncbi:MAG: glycerol kinase GlpK [Deltaproteobacteria bacterium]|nr:glycerol kinase GlpK [Deltaproteobacteria bacterium]